MLTLLWRKPEQRTLLSAAAIAAATAAGIVWSWRKLPDPIIDFGRELYVPWRLSHGAVLYRDIACFNGPLSHYTLAAWFRLLGASFPTLVLANTIVTLATTWVLFRLILLVAGRGSALIACLTFLAMFAFGHLLPTGNYNWICPYSHELTHGAFLSLLSILWIARFHETGHWRYGAGAGVVLGLVFLTKAEVFLAAGAAHVAAIAGIAVLQGWRAIARVAPLYVAAAVSAPAIAWTLLATALEPAGALHATLGSWPYVTQSDLRQLFYFRWHAGLLFPLASARSILAVSGWYLLAFLPVVGLALATGPKAMTGSPRRTLPIVLSFGATASTLALLWLGVNWIDWGLIAQPLPLFLWAITGVAAWRLLVRPKTAADASDLIRLTLGVFSLALLARMILNPRVSHYGFVLAMPATLMTVAALWAWIPRWIGQRRGNAAVFRSAVLGAWLITVAAHLTISHQFMNAKTVLVGGGTDALGAEPARGRPLAEAIEYLKKNVRSGETVAVMPEGVAINFWIRAYSSTPYVEYHPAALMMHGERQVLESLQRQPPDWIVFVHRDHWEYGARYFGTDYAGGLARWINPRYELAAVYGAAPFRDEKFGVMIVRSK